jgi:hypothetical protein
VPRRFILYGGTALGLRLAPRCSTTAFRLRTSSARRGPLFVPAFNPLVAQKALCFFEGGDLATLDVPPLPLASPRLDPDMG